MYAGLDISTQAAKLVVIDASRVTFSAKVVYDEDLPQYQTRGGCRPPREPGESIAPAAMWIEATEILLQRLAGAGLAGRIRGFNVAGQQHGLVALGADGRLASEEARLWNDTTTAAECRELTERVGGPAAMVAEVGNPQLPGYTASKIRRMARREPKIYERTQTFLLVHNYVNHFLTGGRCVFEPSDVSGMALWNPRTRSWSQRVCEAIAPDLIAKLPPVLPPTEAIGTVAPHLCERYGIPPHAVVGPGMGDNMAAAIATGNVEPGVITLSLGTSATAMAFAAEPQGDPSGQVASFCDATGHHLGLVCIANMAGAYNRFRAAQGWSHEEFAKRIPRTAADAILLPWFEGERTPSLPHPQPQLHGVPADKMGDPALMGRVLLEGLLLHLHHGARPLLPAAGDKLSLRLTGGLAQSPVWRQSVADIFGGEAMPVEGEGAAYGAAVHLAWIDAGCPPAGPFVSQYLRTRPADAARPDRALADAFCRKRERYAQLVAQALG